MTPANGFAEMKDSGILGCGSIPSHWETIALKYVALLDGKVDTSNITPEDTVSFVPMLTKFLDYLTASPVGREYFDLTAKKTTNLASTNSTTILQFSVPIPPLTEQEKIIAILDRNTATINEVIAEKETLVSDLESYKKSLIYEVVTGKRRVC